MKRANPKMACVIGWPVEHSRSPLIHGYWLKKYGIDGSYTKEAVKPEDLETFLRSLAANGFSGCNVTVPHKEAAVALADVRDASVVAVGAANTMWLESGKLHAANSDTYGFMTNLTEQAPQWQGTQGPILVFGAGGSARAVIHGFLASGRKDVRIFNRSLDRAREVASHFQGQVSPCNWMEKNHHACSAALIVNTTTLGMNGVGMPEIDFIDVRRECVVADLVYTPLETAFLKDAREHGLKTVDGLGMLMHQAVPGFVKWFGKKPEVTAELRALLEADVTGRASC